MPAYNDLTGALIRRKFCRRACAAGAAAGASKKIASDVDADGGGKSPLGPGIAVAEPDLTTTA
jgi:hypothetical protein